VPRNKLARRACCRNRRKPQNRDLELAHQRERKVANDAAYTAFEEDLEVDLKEEDDADLVSLSERIAQAGAHRSQRHRGGELRPRYNQPRCPRDLTLKGRLTFVRPLMSATRAAIEEIWFEAFPLT
jgi:hypothetical protein